MHAQLAAGDALDACPVRPRTCFQLQLAVFDPELARTFLFQLELAEELACLVLLGDQAERTRDQNGKKEEVQAGHRASGEFLCHTQDRAPRTGIGPDFLGVRPHRPPDDAQFRRRELPRSQREAFGHRRARRAAHEVLHNPILERMKADHDEAP